ncbi:MAG TPA: dolichyl-phosphate beta-glucosyltransferase [bacterium]|jgi:dolichyl-phosphate beta-glucosyltransferase|nr:dolichyl-phosphate beta-glucosyltransferase [bacterium]
MTKKKPTTAPRRPALSIVIPAYNEENRLGPSLAKVRDYVRSRRLNVEVLVVDDGSSDGTAGIVRQAAKAWPALRLIQLRQNLGKGAAVRAGVLAARAGRILFTDADLSTPLEELATLDAQLDAGADLALGSRAMDRSRVGLKQPLYRVLAGRTFNVLVQLVSVPGIQDTQCGFKLFTAEAGKRLFAKQQVPRFGFDVEFLFLARKAGYRLAEVPVRWENSPETKVRPIRDGARAFLDLALIRLYDWQGCYRGL